MELHADKKLFSWKFTDVKLSIFLPHNPYVQLEFGKSAASIRVWLLIKCGFLTILRYTTTSIGLASDDVTNMATRGNGEYWF